MKYKMFSMNVILLCGVVAVSACTYETEKVNIITGTETLPKVTPPDCANWTGTNWGSRHESNFACATRTNMGQMVKEPMDLVAGRGTNYYDGSKTAGAVSVYNGTGAASPAAGAVATTAATAGQ